MEREKAASCIKMSLFSRVKEREELKCSKDSYVYMRVLVKLIIPSWAFQVFRTGPCNLLVYIISHSLLHIHGHIVYYTFYDRNLNINLIVYIIWKFNQSIRIYFPSKGYLWSKKRTLISLSTNVYIIPCARWFEIQIGIIHCYNSLSWKLPRRDNIGECSNWILTIMLPTCIYIYI